MFSTLSPTDIANSALSKIGAQAIQSLTDLSNASAIACNNNFQLAFETVARATRWNCLITTANLTPVAQTPLPPVSPTPASIPWAPYTSYAANVYLSYGNAIYSTQYAYTSTGNFTNDLTSGALVQADYPAYNAFGGYPDGTQYPSGWSYAFSLPSDFILLDTINANMDNDAGYGNMGSDEYEIMGQLIYSNTKQTSIKYVSNNQDTTRWDSLFADCVTYKLASMIATALRQDGGQTAAGMLGTYKQLLGQAITKNAGEKKPYRFQPINSSRFVASRWNFING
jgi:hypothetical protein